MILGSLYIISVGLVVATSILAITVSPMFFMALVGALALPALLTIRTYKSPHNGQPATSEQRVRID